MMLTLDDKSPLGRFVIARNLARQYDFLHTAFVVLQQNVGFQVSRRFVAELNFYGVQFVSAQPGVFRSETQHNVVITGSKHQPPPWEQVDALMGDFMQRFAMGVQSTDPFEFAAFVLWRINWIHPFVQGNGRTARALSYFALSQRLNLWLPGSPIIPELIRATRDEYCDLLADADDKLRADGTADVSALAAYLERLLKQQLASVPAPHQTA